MIGLQEGYINELKNNPNMSLNDKLKIIHNYMNYQPVEVNNNEDIPMSALCIAELLGLDSDIIKKAKHSTNLL